MKKVVLMLIFTVSIGLMSFTSTSEEVKKIDLPDSLQKEKIRMDWECWSRKCIEHEGVSYCTEWREVPCVWEK
tara:strand:+ start:50 stop:268 length:219 start_codon:yes stop_codon:yes gene_type:complete